MRTRAGLGLLAVGAAVISGVSGCSSGSRAAGVTGVVRSFVDAVQ
ncbi:MAG: hypothetical protein QOC66_2717, partial [Pseudonocardiales bacterium]|nr:hypothetical protein [Pseudonocardiales bacterium]